MRRVAIFMIVVLGGYACDGSSDQTVEQVGPEDLTKAAVTEDVRAEVFRRLESTGVEPSTIRVELLIWEVRQLKGRDGPSDLAVAWTSHRRGDLQEWWLGQLFRHRLGADLAWRWEVVRDQSWFNPTVYDHAPSNDDFDAFAKYWDFELEGQNGQLLAGEIDEPLWGELFGEPASVSYPEGTTLPDEL